MAKGENQKLKMLYLAQILSRETDDSHALTQEDIIERLKDHQVLVERKTLYSDLQALKDYGYDIISERRERNVYYHIGDRKFQLPELKLLVDSVQSAKFISASKSRDLIKKLEGLVSKFDATHLHRQVLISGRVKSMNESIYYTVDQLHEAIGSNRQVRFQYFNWNVNKQPELRHDGAWYQVSPWSLMWDDEYYYLVGFDSADAKIKHYRVDKMLKLSVADQPREGRQAFQDFDTAKYSKSIFGMFGGEERIVTIEGDNAMVGTIIDRFGRDITVSPLGEDRFTAQVTVVPSRHFLGWIFALGAGVRITAPEDVVQHMRKEVQRLEEQYNIEGSN